MTNPPGEGQPPQDPHRGPDSSDSQDQQGYWQQQGQPPYAQQPAYGPPPGYGHAPMGYAPDHPRATTALVLGILGVVLCQIVAPFAWSIGKRTMNEIDDSHGAVGGRGAAQAGYILGIVGTVLLAIVALFIIVPLIFLAVFSSGMAAFSY